MILAFLGKLATAQDLTAGATDSENVMQVSANDFVHPTDVWLTIDTETIATGDGSDTYKFQLVLSQEATLDTNKEVCSVTVTGYADKRLATAGRHIVALNVGKMLKDILDSDGSDYPYIGLISTISDGATISINAALSTSEPPTEYHRQVVDSNVTVPTNP